MSRQLVRVMVSINFKMRHFEEAHSYSVIKEYILCKIPASSEMTIGSVIPWMEMQSLSEPNAGQRKDKQISSKYQTRLEKSAKRKTCGICTRPNDVHNDSKLTDHSTRVPGGTSFRCSILSIPNKKKMTELVCSSDTRK